MKIYGIYDNNNNEQCIRVGTLGEIIQFFNLTPRTINMAIKTGVLFRKYKFIYLFDEKEE